MENTYYIYNVFNFLPVFFIILLKIEFSYIIF